MGVLDAFILGYLFKGLATYFTNRVKGSSWKLLSQNNIGGRHHPTLTCTCCMLS